MQQQTINLDGSPKGGVSELEPQYNAPQDLIDHAIEMSIDQATGGFHIIFGATLDGSPTGKTANVIASAGILIFQNVLDPE